MSQSEPIETGTKQKETLETEHEDLTYGIPIVQYFTNRVEIGDH